MTATAKILQRTPTTARMLMTVIQSCCLPPMALMRGMAVETPMALPKGLASIRMECIWERCTLSRVIRAGSEPQGIFSTV